MTDLNSLVITGNITRDCGADERDFGYLANGQARANISIAVNRSKKQGEEWIDEASFFDVTIFGKTAENLKPYFIKGQRVTIQGYIKQNRWTDNEGKNHSKIAIIAEHVWLSGSRKDSHDNNNQKFEAVNNETGFQEDIPYENDPADIPF